MTILLTILHIICCTMLIVVILIQGGRGQGLTGPSFSSGNVQSLFGTRAADFLTKATTAAAICFLITCIGLNWIETRKSKSLLAVNQNSKVDIDAIKKALEKVKAESATQANAVTSSAAAVATDAKATVEAAAQKAETAQQNTESAAKTAQQDVQNAANQATTAPAVDATSNKN